MKKVAVLIPCYNEELTVEKVVRDFRKELPDADIYVYDNNSTDHTAELAEKAGAIVRRETRQGKGNVVRTMFQEIDADAYIMVDGDDTYPAEEVHPLLEAVLNDGVDMAIGDRLSNGTYYNENKRAFHDFGNNLVRDLINRLFHGNIRDIMTGYRVFSRRFAKCMPLKSGGFQIETEITVISLVARMKIVEIPITYRDRPEGSFSKLNTFHDGFRVLIMLFDLYKNYRPLYFFFILSLISLILGLVIFIPSTGVKTMIVGVLFILLAILMFVVGIILDAVKNSSIQMLEEVLNQYSDKHENKGECD